MRDNGTASGSCLVGFLISFVQPSDSATGDLVKS